MAKTIYPSEKYSETLRGVNSLEKEVIIEYVDETFYEGGGLPRLGASSWKEVLEVLTRYEKDSATGKDPRSILALKTRYSELLEDYLSFKRLVI